MDTTPSEPEQSQQPTATAPTESIENASQLTPSGKGKKPHLSRKEAREARKANNTRRGTRPERSERADGEADEGERERSEPRLPKRQCALLLGFCGSGYSGMQFQPHSKTIEGTFFDALVRAGAVSQDNADSISKVNFSRAARTDAGVHAAGNLVSMKLITSIPGVPDIVARINQELPPEIRLWGFERVLKSFNARSTCDSRKYTYYFPSYLLIPPKPGSGQHKILSEHQAGSTSESTPNTDPLSHPFWKDIPAESPKDEDLSRKRDFRASQDAVEQLRATVKKYEGSHKFHNFTVGREYNDRSCVRVMKKIEIAEPVVRGSTEWIAVMFHGQSFMLHQRKMMAALVLSCRTNTPPQVIEELYGPRMAFVPKMPALGLLLEYPIFDSYNKRVKDASSKLKSTDPDYRYPIDFEVYREKIDAFKQEHIYSRMRSIEEQGAVFDAWIRSVDAYGGNDLLYLNPRGVIPDIAIIKRGEKRINPFREKKRFDATTFPAGTDVGKLMANEEEKDVEEDLEEEGDRKLDKKRLAEMEG
ncbi:pseudouridine synthase [Irpex rosettiformis]|uniref:Pseudouridine synthase n=1 Tax=Irpex rosettiformis TaxID=378272 RepID=A0ACB8U6B9_9APHY|nr:pseudouridine synthase [Irpex rosettiformis]